MNELVNMKLSDVDLKRFQIRIESGKGGKDRMVLFAPGNSFATTAPS
jgi:site-specific recombinase XerD